METKEIVIASDHNGVGLKAHLISYLKDKGYKCIDLGPYTEKVKVDYSDYAFQLGNIISSDKTLKGILICGTGVGMSIAVNKIPNVRAALVHNIKTSPLSREHNDANVLCLGSWINSPEDNEEILDSWLQTPFGEGRHVKRVEKITQHDLTNIVFTNGVFDILHPGHIKLFKFAKSLGGKLIVGLNSDRTARLLKGSGRPINNELDRKNILNSIKEIDEVIIFDDVETKEIINKINPNVVVKGSEWTAEEVRMRDKIPDEMDIKIFPIMDEHSTGELINRIEFIHGKKEEVKPQKEIVVFTNGIFDIIHPGHIELFKFCKSIGTKVVVGLNSDRATKELKGPSRPINNENDRKSNLEAIKYVDEVVIFDDVKTFDIVREIKPHIVVKGGEWTAEEVRMRDKIPDEVEVRVVPLVRDYSTTNTLKKIQSNDSWQKKPETLLVN